MDNSPPTTQRVTWFYQRNKEGSIIIHPPFQRKPVWSLKNKSYLIDTIVRGFPIPEIFVQIKTDKDGNTKYIVVDGQQRIRSILEYVDGEFEILEEDSQEYGGKEFSQLPDGIKTEIWDYALVVRELKTNNDADIRAVFQRLNKNAVPLTRQELRNATFTGHFIQLASELADDEYWAEQRIVNAAEIRRMIDVEFVSELLIALLHGIQPKEPDLIDKFYGVYDVKFDEKNTIKNKFLKVKSKIDEIVGDLKPTRWHDKLSYYSLFVAFSDLIENYHFSDEGAENIRADLEKFSEKLSTEDFSAPNVQSYYEAQLTRRANKESRGTKTVILRSLLIPHLVAKDSKRDFNDEERRIFWELSKEKKCGVCCKEVKWEDYSLDHIVPHSKGGKTELKNAQITHKTCNSSKSNK